MTKCITCGKSASFGYSGNKAKYCYEHQLDKMINVKILKCEICGNNAYFGYVGEKARVCKAHKKNGMTVSSGKHCQKCSKAASFDYPGMKGRFCSDHKKQKMIYVKRKLCIHCGKCPSFNYVGLKASYCSNHRLPNMVDVVSIKCKLCDKRPRYNYKGLKKALYCYDHKTSDMINVNARLCKAKLCQTQINISTDIYDGYCSCCFQFFFPDDKRTINYKIKEKEVVNHIKQQFDINLVHDKIIDDGCSKRRPDVFIDLFTHVIIVEIDESGHKDYDTTCENKRLMELSQDIDHRPLVMIRFNPDSYIKADGTKIQSCWKNTKAGMNLVEKNLPDWHHRLDTSDEEINHWLINIPEKTIESKWLFYSEETL